MKRPFYTGIIEYIDFMLYRFYIFWVSLKYKVCQLKQVYLFIAKHRSKGIPV